MKTVKMKAILDNPSDFKMCLICYSINTKYKRKCYFCQTGNNFTKSEKRITENIKHRIKQLENVIDNNNNDTIQIG